MEVDFYIPKYKFAIEFDGFYYHSEFSGGKDSKYHLDKTKICEDLGITLIHIFEDEWLQKRDIVESKIKHLLGIQENRIVAKKCKVQEITSKIKK